MFLLQDCKEGDPVRQVANAANTRRIGNILMTLDVIGGHIERNYSAEGRGWVLVIDGANSTPPPDGVGVVTSDRLFSVDSLSRGRLGNANFTGSDSTGYDSNCLHVHHDVCADSTFSGVSYRQLRMFLRITGTSTTPAYVLGLDSQGSLVKVATTDTCATT